MSGRIEPHLFSVAGQAHGGGHGMLLRQLDTDLRIGLEPLVQDFHQTLPRSTRTQSTTANKEAATSKSHARQGTAVHRLDAQLVEALDGHGLVSLRRE